MGTLSTSTERPGIIYHINLLFDQVLHISFNIFCVYFQNCNISIALVVYLFVPIPGHIMKHHLVYSLLIPVIAVTKIFSQSSTMDSAHYQSAINHIIQLYTDSLKENLRLYNGTEFTAGFRRSAGHPFFEDVEPQKGEIFYEGIFYNNVRLHYDLTHDEVIFVSPENNLNIKLITRKIGWFIISGHLFVNVTAGDSLAGLPGHGFFERIDLKPYSVLIKRTKSLFQPSRDEDSSKFIMHNTYFLKRENICYPVKSKRSLLAFCRDRKSEVSKFMQEENLNFKTDPERTIVEVIGYYSKLKN